MNEGAASLRASELRMFTEMANFQRYTLLIADITLDKSHVSATGDTIHILGKVRGKIIYTSTYCAYQLSPVALIHSSIQRAGIALN